MSPARPIRAMVFFAAAMVFLGAAGPAGAAPATPFNVGIAAPTVNILPLWMGQGAVSPGPGARTALNEPADTQAGGEDLPLLVDLKADLPWIFTALVMDRNYLAAHKGLVKDFLRAYVEAIYVALSDGPRAK